MTVPRKSCEKKVMPFAIPIIEKEKELYTKIHRSDKGIIDINHALFQKPKEEPAEFL